VVVFAASSAALSLAAQSSPTVIGRSSVQTDKHVVAVVTGSIGPENQQKGTIRLVDRDSSETIAKRDLPGAPYFPPLSASASEDGTNMTSISNFRHPRFPG